MANTPVQVKQGMPARPGSQDVWQYFRSEMDRLFDRFSAGFGLPSFSGMFDVGPGFESSFTMPAPAVDVTEDAEGYKVAAELPGLAEKDIEVTLANGVLTLKGEKRQESEKEDRNYHLTERAYGSFRRSFAVPDGVDADRIAATFSNGVLNISMPKSPAAQKAEKKIEVTAAS